MTNEAVTMEENAASKQSGEQPQAASEVRAAQAASTAREASAARAAVSVQAVQKPARRPAVPFSSWGLPAPYMPCFILFVCIRMRRELPTLFSSQEPWAIYSSV